MIEICRNYEAVIGAIVASARNWAIFEYCEIVMRRKEKEEREHQCSAAMA